MPPSSIEIKMKRTTLDIKIEKHVRYFLETVPSREKKNYGNMEQSEFWRRMTILVYLCIDNLIEFIFKFRAGLGNGPLHRNRKLKKNG